MTDPLEQRLRDFPPVAGAPPVLDGDVAYLVQDSPVGRMLLAVRDDGALLSAAFTPDDASADRILTRLAAAVSPRMLRGGPRLEPVRRAFDAYFDAQARTVDVPVDFALATPFQREVLTRLNTEVGYGQRTTYGGLAARLGRPSASRAVGAALGANPLCVVLPCHRVVASSGALTGYAGGLAAKEWLLAMESASPQP